MDNKEETARDVDMVETSRCSEGRTTECFACLEDHLDMGAADDSRRPVC